MSRKESHLPPGSLCFIHEGLIEGACRAGRREMTSASHSQLILSPAPPNSYNVAMKSWTILGGVLMITLCLNAQVPPAHPLTDSSPMDSFVNGLMRQMTLEEKVGQLNLLSVGFDVTGPIISQDVDAKIRQGLVGGVFNTYTPVAARRLQALAVNQSRLHIPLLLGYDVIHGHKTIFPIPLAMSCTWDMDLIRQSAHIAATEATADGLNWTYSPMVDIARDPRWGRIAEGA